MKNNSKITKMVETSVLAALAVVFMFLIRFWLLPGAKFLEYDMGDVPVIIASLFLGPASGSAVLFFVALIQSLTVSAASSWQGFLMHFLSSEVYIIILWLLNKKLTSKKGFIVSLMIGTLSMTAVMIPLNLIFTPMYMGVPVSAVAEMLLPVIIPFNLIKGCINSFTVFLLHSPLKKILEKSNLLPKK